MLALGVVIRQCQCEPAFALQEENVSKPGSRLAGLHILHILQSFLISDHHISLRRWLEE